LSQFTRIDPLFPDLIEFEDGSGCGIGCVLLTHNFMDHDPFTFVIGPIKIERNARIGAYSTILPGVTIGANSIVGAGSLVTKDIPPGSIAYGVPAKIIRKIDDGIDDG
ncbi:MAG: acyltransferase, partial [Promethearchaeota archaeon]